MVDDGGPYVAEKCYEEMLKGDDDAGQRHTRAARTVWNVGR